MDADYVILFKFTDSDRARDIEKYRKLVERLSSVGLQSEVRNGKNHSLLLFVKPATTQDLHTAVYRSRVQDWLHGVRTAAPDQEAEEYSSGATLYPAERLRIVYQLITNPVEEGGAGITAQHGEWSNVDSIFALHDHEYNKAWLKKWATTTNLKPEDLDEIRNRFGEKIAFYFAFTQWYFTALIAIAAFGAGAWLILPTFSPIYAVVNGLLCVFFVEYWKYQELNLATRWAVRNVSKVEAPRHEFSPDREVTDPVTGEKIQVFPAQKRLSRQALQVPFVLLAAALLGSLIATCFAIEIFVSEVYDGPLQSVLVFLPTIILSTTQPLLLGALTSFAERLTKLENYETEGAYERAITQKVFVLNFITSYMGILLTAFVYVPFATVIVPYLDVFSLTVKPFADHEDQLKSFPKGQFSINSGRLRKQVIYFAVTAQIVNQILEIVVPVFKRRGASKFKEMQSRKAAKKGDVVQDDAADDPQEERDFLKRVRNEAELETYDVTADFREMVVQYGYLALFGVVWPPTAISFLINNWIELRTDAAKICIESRRPTPWRAESIGPWLDSLGFLTWFGSITQAAIVYLFSGQGEEGPAGSPWTIKAWALLLTIMLSEHIYFIVLWAVRIFISRLDSPGLQKERAARYALRQKYLRESKSGLAGTSKSSTNEKDITRQSLEDDARAGSLVNASLEKRFWARQRGWEETARYGQSLIEKAATSESKKAK